MKIYSNNPGKTNILHFLGTDLWVKCYVNYTSHKEVYYVRPMAFIHDNFGVCTIFPYSWVQDYGYYAVPEMHDDYIDDWINFKRPFNFSDIEVIQPLEAITTEELYELMGIPNR